MRSYLNLDLTGRTSVVTGASSGIGRAIAEAMARPGPTSYSSGATRRDYRNRRCRHGRGGEQADRCRGADR